MKLFTVRNITFLSLYLSPFVAIAQTSTDGSTFRGSRVEVPFLNITPDSRSGAMGEAGVALSPDVNASFWNPSKLAFLESNDAVSLSYSPWLRHLVPDISLSYLSYAHKLDERNTLGASLRYFNYGSLQLNDDQSNSQGTYTPSEFSFDVTFARKFGDNFSLGLTGRYIHSSISSISFATPGSSQTGKPGNAFAADASMFYKNTYGDDNSFAFGVNISNIGTKISYSDNGPKYFIPTNLRFGAANTWKLDDDNLITVAFDINKQLTPSPPVRDSNGVIISGKNDDVSVPAGIFQSFGDAPGGFNGELKEYSFSPGAEYWYNNQFAIRAGYHYENPSTSDRRYVTLGFGVKYDVFNFDFSYLAASQQNSPLANTLRFTLSANFGGTSNVSK
ncbi:type IX secretion system outer membrane channel protein PorV [Mucilaginibacter dorajii]|uniref:type IX secretion system outer membrane channel protein PorV n=1 Tax=Mucilaginibacter dorajii TaxID=692994 RepID=UPI002169AB57|nr:type IX secretion system outer membrane channel protein PorV [Mucilaginibacter dorajii]MCS3734650.1 hypothetical protein [Mucilaginibacter dorajii]